MTEKIIPPDAAEKIYTNARKEMEMLIKLEGGQTEWTLQKTLANRGESGARLRTTTDSSAGHELVSSADMLQVLSEQAGLPYVKITDYDLSDPAKVKRLLSFIPAQVARDKRVFPLEETERESPGGKEQVLTIAIADPLDIRIVDDLRLMLPEHQIEPVVCNEGDIIDYIDRFYGIGEETIEKIIDDLQSDSEGDDAILHRDPTETELDLEALANAPPVIKLVNLLLIQAIQDRASDLHVEPFAGSLRIRYRVDGVLREIPSPPKSLQLGLISRLKVMAQLNISETRTPQDGRIRLSMQGREIDLRCATVPTVHGESIVMRILDKSAMMLGIAQLGMTKDSLDQLMKVAARPNGIVLVTGPTGCGKTTTLYALLQETFDPGEKFITTEDPVEYELPGIVQVNINPNVNLTFAACLRSILRQDPDVILVGEIRDVETAQIAIQAALTGHMVYSTLHTNSAAATITRLIDMGVEPFLITSTLEAIIGQRLVRTICPSCKTVYVPTDEELEDFGVARDEVGDITFYRGAGCDDCHFTGYKGRMGIFETMILNDDIRELVLQRATTDEIHALAIHHGMQTMRNDGWLKICLGVSTFEEVTRQTPRESRETIKAEMESARRSLDRIEKLRVEREAEDKRVDTEGFDDAHEKPAAAPAAGPAVALAAPPVSQPAAPPPVPEELLTDEAAAQLPDEDSVI
jgi:type II secretion system protein E